MPVPDAHLVSMPPSNVVRSDQTLIVSFSAEKDACPVQEMTSIGQTPGDDLTDKNAPVSSPAISWDEIAALLKQVSCFTTPEPLSTDMDAFFPLTCRFFVDMLGNPPITVAPCLPHDTLEYFLLCIQPMQQYAAVETIEVVRLAPSQFKFPQCLASNIFFNVIQAVVAICNLMRQRALLFKQLEVAKTMRAFFTQRLDNNKELRTQHERAECDLATAQKAITDERKLLKETEEEMEMAKAEVCWMRDERETEEAKCKDAEQKKDQLKKELEELRAVFDAQKKDLEELQAGFAVEKNELEEDYQRKIDYMFFFDYQCCMRKNDITHDIPNYPSHEEDATVSGPTQEDKDSNAVGSSDGQ